MTPETMLEIINAVRGKDKADVVVENVNHAEPLAAAIFESRCLFEMLEKNARLDEIVEQISRKNKAAKRYEKVTGIKWPL